VTLLPLAGRRVLVTRAAHQAGKLSEQLRAIGAEPVEVPVLEIRPPESWDGLDGALRGLDGYDWLVLTSANTVCAMAERAKALSVPLIPPKSLKVAAVGEATAEAARKLGFDVAFVPNAYVAESLAEGLLHDAQGKKVLLVRAAVARDVIPDELREGGAQVNVVDAYRNALPEFAPTLLRSALSKGVDAATFTSSSSVTHLQQAAVAAGVAWPFDDVAAVSIGPITSRTLKESGWDPAIEAERSDIPGLVTAVEKLLGPKT